MNQYPSSKEVFVRWLRDCPFLSEGFDNDGQVMFYTGLYQHSDGELQVDPEGELTVPSEEIEGPISDGKVYQGNDPAMAMVEELALLLEELGSIAGLMPDNLRERIANKMSDAFRLVDGMPDSESQKDPASNG